MLGWSNNWYWVRLGNSILNLNRNYAQKLDHDSETDLKIIDHLNQNSTSETQENKHTHNNHINIYVLEDNIITKSIQYMNDAFQLA